MQRGGSSQWYSVQYDSTEGSMTAWGASMEGSMTAGGAWALWYSGASSTLHTSNCTQCTSFLPDYSFLILTLALREHPFVTKCSVLKVILQCSDKLSISGIVISCNRFKCIERFSDNAKKRFALQLESYDELSALISMF